MNVGDQCHPRGILDKGAYQVIGAAFSHVEQCEPRCEGATACAKIGVMVLPVSADANPISSPAGCEGGMLPSVDGAGRMLLELKHQFDLIYPETDLSQYRVVILPDSGYVSPALSKKLVAFVNVGGSIIASHKASLNDGAFASGSLPCAAEDGSSV